MNKQEYIGYLKTLNRSCECPVLQELYRLKEGTRGLVDKCAHMKAEADLENPREDDLDYLKKYRKNIIDGVTTCDEYYSKLTQMIDDETLELFFHDEKKNYEKRKINKNLLVDLLNKKKIITTHCRNCNQQIDILD